MPFCLIYVKNPENFRHFRKKVSGKFGGSVESAYLCIRFQGQPLASKKEIVL